MQNTIPTPETYEQLINLVTEMFPAMNRGSQRITRYIVQNPNSMAVESVKVIAGNANVQPSSLVRFAKQIGYSGFSEMKKIFQTHLITAASSRESLDSLFIEDIEQRCPASRKLIETFINKSFWPLGIRIKIRPEQRSRKRDVAINTKPAGGFSRVPELLFCPALPFGWISADLRSSE